MSAPAASMETMLADLVRRIVREELARAAPGPELLSQRQAARVLRVGRGGTLKTLIDSGQIKTVPVEGREKIARAEIDRFLSEGTTPEPRRRASRRAVAERGSPTALRRLSLKDL